MTQTEKSNLLRASAEKGFVADNESSHPLLHGSLDCVNPNNPRLTEDVTERSEGAARQLGLDIIVLKAGTANAIENEQANLDGARSEFMEQFDLLLGEF